MNSIPIEIQEKQFYDALDFVYMSLVEWRLSISMSDFNDETVLNEKLAEFLSAKIYNELKNGKEYNFLFNQEKKQNGKSRIDVYAYSVSCTEDVILLIECKRLIKDRYIEYVKNGNDSNMRGGIQRFKENKHGTMTCNASMIGYIENESANYFFEIINRYIAGLKNSNNLDKLEWSDLDKLIMLDNDSSNGLYKYKSQHKRINKSDNITLYHMWIDLHK